MRKKALITIVGNGGELFKLWYHYYQQFFEAQDIYVLDFNSQDGSTDDLQCNVLSFPDKVVSKAQIPFNNNFLNKFKGELLDEYETIVYADYDEILYYENGLDTLVENLKDNYLNPFGFEIVERRGPHGEKIDEPFDYSKKVLQQRRHWYRNNSFDKPLITKINFRWAQGNHTAYSTIPAIVNKRPKPSRKSLPPRDVEVRLPNIYMPGFYLLHLKYIDYERCKETYKNVDLRINWLSLMRKLQTIPKSILEKKII